MNTRPDLPGFEQRLLGRLTEMDATRPVAGPVARHASPRWRRPAVVVAAIVAVVAAGAAATAASLLDNPDTLVSAGGQVHPGGYLFLKGAGCAPAVAVAITWDGASLTATVTGPDGLFEVTATIPERTALGAHTVTARCGRNGPVMRLTVSVDPAVPPVALPPDFAIAGAAPERGQFAVKGAGCRPGVRVAFTAPGWTIGTATADGTGAYNAVLPAGDLGVGDHPITAACLGADGKPLTRTATLTVVPPAEATGTKSTGTPPTH